MSANLDAAVVDGFGDEWSRFDQSVLAEGELAQIFDQYFDLFPWKDLPPAAVGMDVGCGSGRWARLVAPRVGHLICADASPLAVAVARRTLAVVPNTEVVVASVDELPSPEGSLDFAYSLGVLHHVPDTAAAIRSCVRKLRPGAPILLYLYYRFDNRAWGYRLLWRMSDVVRHVVSRFPYAVRFAISQLLAAAVYWPLARVARAAEKSGADVRGFPLSYYRNRSFYVMRTDALDRFGTKLEKRFTRDEVETMMRNAGLVDIVFNPHAPFWCAIGRRGDAAR